MKKKKHIHKIRRKHVAFLFWYTMMHTSMEIVCAEHVRHFEVILFLRFFSAHTEYDIRENDVYFSASRKLVLKQEVCNAITSQ